uniref:EF-hand domain-containing protein n=1 Tax=Calcidiscus leptoporus TaxID=127549 RepID=A0A7S0IUM2_9EUKA|mmetsp:Transcript_23770/g.55090  ORF Transcript_23770/g.55090 Transcript_23770/m.55090 type:complete len:643 (+) Transcript_23770:2-1930(+)
MMGGRMGRILVDPFAPEKVQRTIQAAWDSVWPEIATNMRDDMMLLHGLRNKKKRQESVAADSWPPPPPLFPLTYVAVRARIRYAVMPADIGFWQLIRRPELYPVLFLLFFPFASISTITWVVLLLMIDKSDEYQLTNYILVFRAAVFLSVGVWWSIKGFVYFYLCISAIDIDCLDYGPGVSDIQTLKIAMTLARLACGWIAFVLLVRLRLEQERADRVSFNSLKWQPGFFPKTKEERLERTKTAKRAVTSYEIWAAVGCAGGLLAGFVIGSVGTLLLFFEFSFDGRPHAITLGVNTSNILLPISLMPSVGAVAGTAGGVALALGKEIADHRVKMKEAQKMLDESERNSCRRQTGAVDVRRLLPHLVSSVSAGFGVRNKNFTPSKMPAKLTPFERTLWRAFNNGDLDGSGTLKSAELPHTLRLCGIKASEEEIEELLSAYDHDRSGGLEWPEFRELGLRLKHHVRVPEVNMMTKLLLFEAITFSTTVLVVILNGWLHIGPEEFWAASPHFFAYVLNVMLYGPEEPVVRMTIYFGTALGSLLSFWPFLVFKFPLVGQALLKVKATGYDQAGNVRPVLTRMQRETKAERIRREEWQRYKGKRDKFVGAAARDQGTDEAPRRPEDESPRAANTSCAPSKRKANHLL